MSSTVEPSYYHGMQRSRKYFSTHNRYVSFTAGPQRRTSTRVSVSKNRCAVVRRVICLKVKRTTVRYLSVAKKIVEVVVDSRTYDDIHFVDPAAKADTYLLLNNNSLPACFQRNQAQTDASPEEGMPTNNSSVLCMRNFHPPTKNCTCGFV